MGQVKAVIVGFDRHINYLKISHAFRYLTDDPECLFIATNLDRTYPTPTGTLPGTGTLVKMVEEAVGRAPIVTGKPSRILLDVIRSKYVLTAGLNGNPALTILKRLPDMDPTRTLMVGDRWVASGGSQKRIDIR